MCLAFKWAEAVKGKHASIMREVKGLPRCGSTLSEKLIWNEDDTLFGIDVPTWIQEMNQAYCNDEDCQDYCINNYNGAFVDGVSRHVCYSYQILDGVCIVIKYDPILNQYNFHGGCFPEGKTYRLKQATFGTVEKFTHVEIEVRDLSDPITQAGELSNYHYGFAPYWRYFGYFLLFLFLVGLAILGYTVFDILITRKKIRDFDEPKDMGADINQGAFA